MKNLHRANARQMKYTYARFARLTQDMVKYTYAELTQGSQDR